MLVTPYARASQFLPALDAIMTMFAKPLSVIVIKRKVGPLLNRDDVINSMGGG